MRRRLALLPAVLVAACSAGELVLPPAPASLSARARQEGVTVSWEPVGGASEYRVLVARDPLVTPETVAVLASAREIAAAGPPLELDELGEGAWYFRVVTSRAGFLSPPSAAVSAAPVPVAHEGLVPLPGPAWVATNAEPASRFGYPTLGAGDVDGDGFDDLLVGAYQTVAGGTAYLHLGGPDGLSEEPAFVRPFTQTTAHFAKGMSSPGDVDGDGLRDLLIAAAEYDGASTNEGRAYVYPGTGDATLFGTVEVWSQDSDQVNAYMGRFTAAAGDVNGDGRPDFVVERHAFDDGQLNEGQVAVWYGRNGAIPELPDWSDGSDQANALLGYALSPRPGDADGDGVHDLLAGAWMWNGAAGSNVGAVFLYRGSVAGLEAAPSWSFEGEEADARLGGSLSFAGDVNGDGFDDVIAGADQHDIDRGRAYLFFGGPGGLAPSPAWVFDGEPGDNLGMGVGAAGDVNADGFDDVLVGAHGASALALEGGRVHLFLGGPAGLAAAPAWTWDGPDVEGHAGGIVGSAGDVNGDGSADIAVGVVSFETMPVLTPRARVFFGPPAQGPAPTLPPQTVEAGTSAPLAASFEDPARGGAARCEWDFGDGSAPVTVEPCSPSDAGAPAHPFPPGRHVVRLRVTNAYGLAGEAIATVRAQ